MSGKDYDVIEMDFPPYVEEYSPFPDVEPDFNFEDNKEEIYLRNRIIAAQEQVKLLKEEERKRLEKQERFREMTEAAKAADRAVMAARKKQYWDKLVLPVSIITVCAIIALVVVLSGRLSKPPVNNTLVEENEWLDMMRQIEATWAVTQTEAATQVSAEPIVTEISEEITEDKEAEYLESIAVEEPFENYATETEINDEMRKTTAIREPFAEDGSSYIYNTAAMSYKFTPMYTENQYGQTFLSIYVTVKNLTNYNYAIVPNFVIDNNGDLTRASVNESSSSQHSSYAEQLVNGEWVKTDTQFIAYDFDKKHLCSFRLQFFYRETTGVFSFAPSTRISREYAEKSDKDFQIPLEEILKYI